MAETDDEANETSALLEKGDFTGLLPIKVGPYIHGADSFFYTFSQGLAKLGESATVQELRIKCKGFAENNPPPWFTESLASHEYLRSSVTQDDVDSYISGITEDREGQAAREGRILCHLYDTKLYMMYPYFGIYYIMIAVDESGVKYNNNIDLSYVRNIYISDMDGEYYQTVSINKLLTERNETLATSVNSTTSYMGHALDSNENDIEEIFIINKKKEVIITALKELRCAIIEGNIDSVKYIDKLLRDNDCLDKTLLANLYSEVDCLTKNVFIILATMHKQVDILYYLLYNTDILYYLTREQTDMVLEDEEQREAFIHAMCSGDFKMLEILYDYWCSSIHWAWRNRDPENHVIRDLLRLSRLLNDARDRCEHQLVKNQQMCVNVHCIIQFTTYQIEVYTELRDLRLDFDCSDNSKESRKSEAERARKIILNILRIHEKHSDINNIRLRKSMDYEERSVQSLLADNSSVYTRALLHVMYELYYRKLDFNVSLLLLHNLHILKQRLKTPKDTYQKLECALYYYVYRVSEDWRLYLPINRDILTTGMVGVHNGIFYFMKTLYDPHKLLNGPIIYFERRHFQKSLSDFKESLGKIDISDNIRNESKLTKDEIHCLTLLPYMRDDYSLKRIVHYIEAVLTVDMEKDKIFGMLIIERVVQVVGEMFKDSNDSLHLSTTTKALLQTAAGVETVKKLQKLRDKLSHAEHGELTVKIRIEEIESDLFKEIKTDLETIIHRINTVLQIYKTIVDKSLVSKGLDLLQERLNELPNKTIFYIEIIKTIFHAYNIYNDEIYRMLENNFIKETWSKLGFTKQLFREIGLITVNSEQLAISKSLIKKHTMCISLGTLPKYFEIINNALKKVKDNYELWSSIKSKLPNLDDVVLSDFPTQDDIERVTNKLRSIKKKGQHINDELLDSIKLIKDYTHHWESIREVLRFILEEVQIFENNPFEIKKNRCSAHFYRYIQDSSPDDKAIRNVNDFMEMIKYEVNRMLKIYATDTIQESFEPREFRGIDKMMNLFSIKDCNESQNKTDEYMKEKRGELFTCLIHRIDLLKKILNHPKNIPESQHLVRYECDQKFRIAIEMLLADIMNVFVACKIDSPLIKSSNLLKAINLRNVLDHGNPLLEVIGGALDAQDIPTEFITWAMTIINDSEAIEALRALFNEKVEFDTIEKDKFEKMTAEQNQLLAVFKSCKRWQDYLKLIPKTWQNKSRPEPKIRNEGWEKLKAAVRNKELENVRLHVNSVDLDLVDDSGKALLHYAAMNGNVGIIEVLIENGANVNVADGECGKRPLHYAAMNGMAAAVTTLLQHRADTTLLDTDEKLAINYVNKEKHEQLLVQLAQHLTVQLGFYLCVFIK